MTENAYFSLLSHIKQLLSVTLCFATAGIGSVTGQTGHDGTSPALRLVVKAEIVLKIQFDSH